MAKTIKNITLVQLEKMYSEQQLSCKDIATALKCKYYQVQYKLHQWGISTRSPAEANKVSGARRKQSKALVQRGGKLFKVCPDCKKEYPATNEFFFKQGGKRLSLRRRCKKCHTKHGGKASKKKYSPRRTERQFQKMIKEYKTTTCMICNSTLQPKGWIRHHLNYETDTRVLICRACHNWLHGRNSFGHRFHKEYTPDLASYEFVQRVFALYINHDPRMKETVKCNLSDFSIVKEE